MKCPGWGFEGIWLMKRMNVSGWRGRLRSSSIGLEAVGNNTEWEQREGTVTWQCRGQRLHVHGAAHPVTYSAHITRAE